MRLPTLNQVVVPENLAVPTLLRWEKDHLQALSELLICVLIMRVGPLGLPSIGHWVSYGLDDLSFLPARVHDFLDYEADSLLIFRRADSALWVLGR